MLCPELSVAILVLLELLIHHLQVRLSIFLKDIEELSQPRKLQPVFMNFLSELFFLGSQSSLPMSLRDAYALLAGGPTPLPPECS